MNQFFLAIMMLFVSPMELLGAGPAAKNCGLLNLRKISVGQSCLTTKGNLFTLVYRSESGREAWLDTKSSILWGDKLSQRVRRQEAKNLCKQTIQGENKFQDSHLSKLPTLEDFKAAEEHGIREVLPNIQDHFYWADSSIPGAKNIGHVFNGNIGKAEIVVYRSINFENVRCIDRNPRLPLPSK